MKFIDVYGEAVGDLSPTYKQQFKNILAKTPLKHTN